MERDLNLTNKLIKFSKKIGIDLIGFADPKYFERYEKRNKPNYFLKEVKSIIILANHLFDIILDTYCMNPDTGKNFQFLDSILEVRCYQVRDLLKKEGFEAVIIPYNPGLYLKETAALAGMGPIGKNNLLITEEFGSQIRLRAIATNALLIVGEPVNESKYCRNCKICFEACPADAFFNGKYNREKCLNYNQNNKEKISDYSEIWCNICINSCPIGKIKEKYNS